MVKIGDKVEVGGRTAVVESVWAQGAHKRYNLDDGSSVLDLDKKVEAGSAKVLSQAPTKKQEKEHHPWKLPKSDEDLDD
jgi:hypothetical protein